MTSASHSSAAAGLSDRDCEILVFERTLFRYAGTKEAAVREKFDMNMHRYYQVLNALIDREDALAFDPLVVNRLRRLREQRKRTRRSRA